VCVCVCCESMRRLREEGRRKGRKEE